MRYLLIILLVLVLIALARTMRRGPDRQRPGDPSAKRQARDMVACEHCGVHLVQDDALITRNGNYRCPEHAER